MKTSNKQVKTIGRNLSLLGILACSGLLAQQNGLNNTTNPPNIELGGPMIQSTNITLDNSGTQYNLVLNGEGQFGMGNTLNAASGLGTSKAIFTYTNNTAVTGFNPMYGTIGAYYSSAPGTTLPSDVRGIINNVTADCQNMWGYESTVKGNAGNIVGIKTEVIGRTVGGSFSSTGVIGNAYGSFTNFGGKFMGHTPPGQGPLSASYGVHAVARGETDNYAGFFIAD